MVTIPALSEEWVSELGHGGPRGSQAPGQAADNLRENLRAPVTFPGRAMKCLYGIMLSSFDNKTTSLLGSPLIPALLIFGLIRKT